MKHKVWIGVACISVVLGAMLVGAGFGLGGKLHDVYGVHFGIGNGDDQKSTGNTEIIELKEFENLSMDISIGDIEVRRGSSLNLSIINVSNDEYTIKYDDETLRIESHQDVNLFNFSFNSLDYKFILTIPNDMTLNAGDIESKMGDVELSNLSFQTLTINQKMGDIDINNVNSEQMTLDQKMGDITYAGKQPGNMKIDNAMGDIELDIQTSSKQYYYECSTSMGSIKVDNQHQDGMSEEVTGGYKDAPYTLIVDDSLGDIEVNFAYD